VRDQLENHGGRHHGGDLVGLVVAGYQADRVAAADVAAAHGLQQLHGLVDVEAAAAGLDVGNGFAMVGSRQSRSKVM